MADNLFPDISSFFTLLIKAFSDLFGLDSESLKFSNPQVFYVLGLLLLMMFVAKLLSRMIGRYKSYRKGSGHFIFKKHGLKRFEKIFRLVIPCLVMIPLFAFIAALAGVYKDVDMVEYVETDYRQQMVLIDTSVSVGWESNEPKKSWADLIRDGYSELLNLRAGRKDRTSVWIFSNHPYLVSDFVNDSDYLRDKVYKAPYVMIDPASPYLSRKYYINLPNLILPDEKIMETEREGGTNLALALSEMLDYLERNGDKKYKQTTIIVLTDGSPNSPVDKQLELLREKKIKLLVLHMHNGTYDRNAGRQDSFGIESRNQIEESKKFREDVIRNGGEFFTATNKSELRAMYRKIDEQEPVSYNEKLHKNKEDYSDKFLTFGVSALFFAIMAGLLVLVRKGTSP